MTAGAVATRLLWPLIGRAASGIPVVVGHVFAFRSVAPPRRSAEPRWAAVFVGGACRAWCLSGELDWAGALAFQATLTLVLVTGEIRSPSYHGIGADRHEPRSAARRIWTRDA